MEARQGNPENKWNLKLIIKLKQSGKYGHVLHKGKYLDQRNLTEHLEINTSLTQSTDFGQGYQDQLAKENKIFSRCDPGVTECLLAKDYN